jgi:hypothetical protein
MNLTNRARFDGKSLGLAIQIVDEFWAATQVDFGDGQSIDSFHRYISRLMAGLKIAKSKCRSLGSVLHKQSHSTGVSSSDEFAALPNSLAFRRRRSPSVAHSHSA